MIRIRLMLKNGQREAWNSESNMFSLLFLIAMIAPSPDFFIGAHATVSQFELITRDSAKYNTYYPQLKLIDPKSEDH